MERAQVHHRAARDWRATAERRSILETAARYGEVLDAKTVEAHRAYYLVLAETLDELAVAHNRCAGLLLAATLAIDGVAPVVREAVCPSCHAPWQPQNYDTCGPCGAHVPHGPIGAPAASLIPDVGKP